MYILAVFLIFTIICLLLILWNYQWQIQDICRQIAFLKEKDSNMLISRQFDFGGIGMLCDQLNDLLLLRKEERKKYREKERLVSETYTSLSHDIRTPLTSLDGYVQLLETSLKKREKSQAVLLEAVYAIQGMDGVGNILANGQGEIEKLKEYKEEQIRYTEIMKERIHSLKDLLEEIFTFIKLKNESYHLELSLCCMNRILKNVIFAYYEDWKERGIEPELDITEEMLSFMGNEQAMNRVLQNIIKNALDHGEKFLGISLQKKESAWNFLFVIKQDIQSRLILYRYLSVFIKRIRHEAEILLDWDLQLQKSWFCICRGQLRQGWKGKYFLF